MRCEWKLVEADQFELGMPADRCGKDAVVEILRPQRRKNLVLCECHLNQYIEVWGLKQNVRILCP